MRTVSLGASDSTLPSECQICGGQLSTAIDAFWPEAAVVALRGLGSLGGQCPRLPLPPSLRKQLV